LSFFARKQWSPETLLAAFVNFVAFLAFVAFMAFLAFSIASPSFMGVLLGVWASARSIEGKARFVQDTNPRGLAGIRQSDQSTSPRKSSLEVYPHRVTPNEPTVNPYRDRWQIATPEHPVAVTEIDPTGDPS
jgi:hypothetical protein